MGCGASTAAPSTAYAIVPPDKKVEGAPAVERRKTLLGEQEEVALAKEVELTSPRGTAALAPGSGFRDASADGVARKDMRRGVSVDIDAADEMATAAEDLHYEKADDKLANTAADLAPGSGFRDYSAADTDTLGPEDAPDPRMFRDRRLSYRRGASIGEEAMDEAMAATKAAMEEAAEKVQQVARRKSETIPEESFKDGSFKSSATSFNSSADAAAGAGGTSVLVAAEAPAG